MSIETLEKRVTDLEKEMAQLRATKTEKAISLDDQDGPRGTTAPDWLRRVSGMFANEPLFDEMTKYVEQERESERSALPAGDNVNP